MKEWKINNNNNKKELATAYAVHSSVASSCFFFNGADTDYIWHLIKRIKTSEKSAFNCGFM